MSFSLQPETLARIDHRMQFLLGHGYVDGFEGWRRSEVAGGLRLTSHPDLNLTNVTVGSVELSLLGYILDPEAPSAGDADILTRIAGTVAEGGDLFVALEPYGGRYLLIADLAADAGALRIVGDPVGSLQLFYTFAAGEVWCAAQPHLLEEHLGLAADQEALQFHAWLRAETDEPSWPVDVTHLEAVSRLLPNHYLDLHDRSMVRYWPRAPRVDGDTDELRPMIAAQLAGLMAAAANRFDLAMGVSAGYDSRVMLAASRQVADKLVYYTGQGGKRGAGHPDVAVPTAMLAAMAVEHDIIVARESASQEFSEVFRRSISFSHLKREAGQQSQLDRYRLGRVAVLGNASEIARNHLRTSKRAPPLTGRPTAEHLGLLMAMSHPFAQRHFQRWLDEVGDTFGYDVLDLFFWEHRHGSWFAQNCSQFTIGWQDIFLPFNCRSLFVNMLAVPLAHRADRGKAFYRSLVEEMWPELLAYPINPEARGAVFRRFALQALRKVKRALFSKNRAPMEAGAGARAGKGAGTGPNAGATTVATSAAKLAANPGNSPVLDGKNRLT